MKTKKKITRKFLGNLFPERKDANYEKAHLKAYLKGFTRFGFGKYSNGDQIYHEVKQEIVIS